MNHIAHIRKLSLYIFLVPFIAVNLCLLISLNWEILEHTVFSVDQIGRSYPTIPYLDGSLSISRASRTFPQYLLFKPSMVLTSFLLFYYWKKNNTLINELKGVKNINFFFRSFGVMSAFFLIIHSLLLGVEFDIKIFKLLRRLVLLSFIIFEIVAQSLLVYKLYELRNGISHLINKNVLYVKIILVSLLSVVAILSIPLLISSGNTHFKHALEWNYFVGVIFFYFLTSRFWRKKTT
jgi:hypothetical protein